MGRFSPSIPLQPSWTQGLAEGVGGLGDALIQARQRKFQNQIAQSNEDRENAQAGYTPNVLNAPNSDPASFAQSNPVALSQMSNAGNAAVTPQTAPLSQYDPTKSQMYQVWQPRLENKLDIAQAQIAGRQGVADTRVHGFLSGIAARYGSINPLTGEYNPGVQTESQEAVQQPRLDFNRYKLGIQSDQFQQKNGSIDPRTGDYTPGTQALGVNYDNQNKPVRPLQGRGGLGGIGGGAATGPEMTFIRNRQARLQQPQSVPGTLNADGSSLMLRHTPGLSGPAAFQEAKHEANLGRLAAGMTDTIPDAPRPAAVAPVSTAPHVTKDGTAASTVAPPVQGTATPMLQNNTDQHQPTVSDRLPASPTAPSTTSATKPKLSLQDRQKAATDPGFQKFLADKYKMTKGVDY